MNYDLISARAECIYIREYGEHIFKRVKKELGNEFYETNLWVQSVVKAMNEEKEAA
jgi:hypothetical protein